MSTINQIPDKVFYDPDAWIDLAPDYDYSELIPVVQPPVEPEPEPEVPEDPEPTEPDPEA